MKDYFDNIEQRNEVENLQAKKAEEFLFKNTEEVDDYLRWKEEVSEPLRIAVERSMLGNDSEIIMDHLPKTSQFLNAFRKSCLKGELDESTISDGMMKNLLRPMSHIGVGEDHFLDIFKVMIDRGMSWNLKMRLCRGQVQPILNWLIDRDIEDANKKADEELSRIEQKKENPENKSNKEEDDKSDEFEVPSANRNSISSMETQMEKREGTPKALFKVKPFYGGYATNSVCEEFDPRTIHFTEKDRQFTEVNTNAGEVIPHEKTSTRIMYGLINGGDILPIPLYYNFTILPESIETNAPMDSVKFFRDQDGIWYLHIDKPGTWKYHFHIAKALYELPKANIDVNETKVEKEQGGNELPEALTKELDTLKGKRLPTVKMAREAVKLIRDHLTYSNSNEAWQKYIVHPDKFFHELWTNREADCYVANTLACRAHEYLGIKSRFIGGHYIKNKSEDGSAIMHSGSGHAWHEIGDKIGRKWIRLDATPKGDPTLDESEQEKDLEGEEEGDYGEDDEIMSRKECEKKIREMKKGSEGRRTSERRANQEEYEFAREANCTEAQARQFLADLDRAREIKNEGGESISKLLIKEWKKIAEERKKEKSEYRGPVRMSQGTRLEDPIRVILELEADSMDPSGFAREDVSIAKEYEFGGINIYFNFDLSGSMAKPDSVSGRAKVDVQKDTALLFIDSLMQCAFLYRRDAVDLDLLPLKIMVTVASGTAEVKLPLTDHWGPKEQWQFYSALNQLASGGTPTHDALFLTKQSMIVEANALKKKVIKSDQMPIDYVICTFDGEPDDLGKTLTEHQALKDKGAVVRGYIIGGDNINNPDYTQLDSFSRLPETMSHDIIEQFKKLRPNKIMAGH